MINNYFIYTDLTGFKGKYTLFKRDTPVSITEVVETKVDYASVFEIEKLRVVNSSRSRDFSDSLIEEQAHFDVYLKYHEKFGLPDYHDIYKEFKNKVGHRFDHFQLVDMVLDKERSLLRGKTFTIKKEQYTFISFDDFNDFISRALKLASTIEDLYYPPFSPPWRQKFPLSWYEDLSLELYWFDKALGCL